MNYQDHYIRFIDRAKNRSIDTNQYYEKHHIIPQCLGGNDKKENLVKLTGREHFIAHQLLVKVYPKNPSIIKAASRMCSFNSTQDRSHNRLYEWLRIKLSDAMKLQIGSENSQFDTVWIFNNRLKLNKKVRNEDLLSYTLKGWEKGRRTNWEIRICKNCKSELPYKKRNNLFCSKICENTSSDLHPSIFDGREQELIDLYNESGSLNKTLKEMGMPGAFGEWYYQAKTILNKHK